MEKKKILVLNGSFCELPLIKKAKEMGFYVITTGNMPNLIGHKFADQYICCDYSDKESILQLVKDNQIEGIISCANDFGVLTAAFVCEKMGWNNRQDSYETAMIMHHKDLFKKFTYDNNISAPISTCVKSIDEAEKIIKKVAFPIIVKANDLTGGKGIKMAENIEEAKLAIEYAFAQSRDKIVVIEPFLKGTQHTFETFIVNGEPVTYTSCNCYSPINPYLIQTEIFPADNIEKYKNELLDIVYKICHKLNLKDGILALQYIVCDDNLYIIEMMRRPFGNDFLTLCAFTTGFDMIEGHIRSQLGMDCQCLIDKIHEPEMRFCGHHGIMAVHNGDVKGYTIPEDIRKHIYKKIDMFADGKMFLVEDYLKDRIAYIFYQYDNKEEMLRDVLGFNERIQIHYQ